ncbi:acetate/propionate family kinase [Blastococcus sp. MG754426]|uniref:acetate/propionate family kinase n=1 Tax=unclassified Blastococcus TaxID=2619396 RepID=UPI001EF11421|nr:MULTISPECIES: acetate/propionate family kinase [unclassified Blastococcus]MCF6507307.1 acetate/propionate family kinase [Blastococcus sp. MG754426]MCF6510793.1 acetate/propionate family kinase [Blastococcus sp. MG754427]MCF6734357.1 acetate/propionate family kinase [Blastococcus sp. KM273129]
MRVLVVNAGSSSLKLAVVDDDGTVAAGTTVEGWRGEGDLAPLTEFLAGCGPVDAVGHRVVHGGPRHSGPAVVDDVLVPYLWSISHLAPLHNPRALAGVRAAGELLPGVPAVACFDTTFHATLPPAAATYAVPREWNERYQLRRYGFHGLSHAWAVRRGAELVGRPVEELRIVSCHLGAGGSLAAVRGGRSVDTTMGFTPLAGLVMNTRPGTLDPGLVLWLLEHGGVPVPELSDVLEHHAGLKGLSGTSGDLREVLDGVAAGDADCVLALDVYLHRLVREVAAMTAAAGGLDLLVMTGGVGEHAPRVRAAVAGALPFLGLALDPGRNEVAATDADVSADGAAARTVVVTAREDLEIHRQVVELLGG